MINEVAKIKNKQDDKQMLVIINKVNLNQQDNTIEYYENNNLFNNINNKKIYSEIKENVYRFIN